MFQIPTAEVVLSWEQGSSWDSQLWEPHLLLFCLRLMEKSPTRRTPRKLHVLNSSVSKSTPRNNERWDSQGVEHCAVIFGLLGNRRSDDLLRRALLEGKDPSHYNIICVFPGFPLVQFTHPAGKFLSHLTKEKESFSPRLVSWFGFYHAVRQARELLQGGNGSQNHSMVEVGRNL